MSEAMMSSGLGSPGGGGGGGGSPKGNYGGFQMPLHYPRYKKSDYEKMPEWQLERLLNEYGLPAHGDLDHKRKFAMGAFLWPDQF